MKYLVFILFFNLAQLANAQKDNRVSILLYINPEFTLYTNNYSAREGSLIQPGENKTKASFNAGSTALMRYEATRKIFIEFGVGYISRQLKSTVFFDQSAPPPPRQSFDLLLRVSKSVKMRIIEFPLNFGYKFKTNEKSDFFAFTGIVGNYLINTDYGVTGNFSGSYKKGYWQGITVNVGGGADHQILKKVILSGRLSYSIINTVKKDEYLYDQSNQRVKLDHNFIRISAGARLPI